MSHSATGKIKHRREITIDNVSYDSIKEAARLLNVGYPGLVGKLACQRRHNFTEFTLHPVYENTKHTEMTKEKIRVSRTGQRHSQYTKDILSKKAKQRHKINTHPMCREITINGHHYSSIKEASKQLKVNYSTLRWRIQQDTSDLGKTVTAVKV